MSDRLKVQFLGGCSLSFGGSTVDRVDTKRLRMLLAFLLLHRGRAELRSRVAFLFWPDSGEGQALTNLRHLLHELRKALPAGGEFIAANAKTIQWSETVETAVDVEEFELALAEANRARERGDRALARQHLEAAVALYRGDLLPDLYEDWVEEARAALREKMLAALVALVELLEAARDYPAAIRYGILLRGREPAREKTHVTLMRLSLLSGDRAKALQAYHDCERLLREALDASPSEATSAFFREIKAGSVAAVAEAPATVAGVAQPEHRLQGRDREWALLRRAWARSSEGGSHLAVLLGEAGIGKSRLAEELFVTLQRQGVAACRTRSYAAEGRLAYAPVCQWMRSPALRPALAGLDPVWLAEIARVLPELRIERPDLPEPAKESGNWQRHLLFEALARAVLAKGEPVLLLLDDMQWTDLETLEWLRFLLRYDAGGRVLIVGTIRQEELHPEHPLRRMLLELNQSGQVTEIALGPLAAGEVARIAAEVAGYELEPRVNERLYETTQGNPLFVVESVRAGLKDRRELALNAFEGLDPSLALPPKVQAVFETRLAQLSSPALDLTRIAAVFGRAFSMEMLEDVSGFDESATIGLLDELWEKRIIREQEAGLYDFTHDRLREVAYEQISTPKRRLLHRKSSDVLEKFFHDDLDRVMAQLASHYEEAGQVSKAVEAYRRAGQGAMELFATREAIRLFEKALGLLARQPASPAHLEKELELCTALGVCQVAENGYQAPGVQRVYERSQALCKLLGRPISAPILRALALYNLVFGNLHETIDLGGQLRAYYEESGDEILYVESEYVLGVASFWLGRIAESRAHLERSIGAYKPALSQFHLTQYAQDPKAICLCRLGWSWILLGELDRGAALVAESIVFARQLDHPHTEGYVLSFGGQVLLSIGDRAEARRCVERFQAINVEHQLPFWETRCEMMLGYLEVVEEGERSGLARLRRNFELCVERQHTISLSSFLVLFVRAYLHLGEPEEGLQVLDTLKGALTQSDERFYDAELLRIRGEVLLACDHPREAVETLFTEALAVARAQGSRLLELRAAFSLARLWEGEERGAASLRQLREVFDRFTEGFSRPDLEEVRAFLGD